MKDVYEGMIFTNCPECNQKVWFDCLDQKGINNFILNKEICSNCKKKRRNNSYHGS